MFNNNALQLSKLARGEAIVGRQAYRSQPIFRDIAITFHMNMRWFAAFVGIEEEPVWAKIGNFRHQSPRDAPHPHDHTRNPSFCNAAPLPPPPASINYR